MYTYLYGRSNFHIQKKKCMQRVKYILAKFILMYLFVESPLKTLYHSYL